MKFKVGQLYRTKLVTQEGGWVAYDGADGFAGYVPPDTIVVGHKQDPSVAVFKFATFDGRFLYWGGALTHYVVEEVEL